MNLSLKTRKEIKTVAEELASLNEKRKIVSKRLKKAKETIADNLDDTEAFREVQALKSQWDILNEITKNKERTLTALEEKLSDQIIQEEQQKKYDHLKELCRSAEEKSQSYFEKLEELDRNFVHKLMQLLLIKLSWKKDAEKFMRLADELGKGFRVATENLFYRKGKESELGRDELIEKLESEGLSLNAVMSEKVLRTRYYSMTKSNNYPELTFKIYYALMEKKVIYDKLEK